jgi:ribosomal protein S18 acetylase RimI-like enzyme
VTITLRPTAPERHTEDGRRTRAYQVCVNARQVGTVLLATDDRLGAAVGRIERLVIDEPDRHRGRGTAAALAVEEVLRGWGCTAAAVSIPAARAETRGLAVALGYAERGRTMLKQLSEPPPLPPASEPRAMTDDEYPAWYEHAWSGYVRSLVAHGLAEEQARAKSDADHAALLPDGPASPGACLRILGHGGVDVGFVWVGLSSPQPGPDAYVYSVEVAEEHRGHGHGRTLMLLAERESLAAGAHSLGLFVFAGNTPAQRLYRSLDYRATDYHYLKPLV